MPTESTDAKSVAPLSGKRPRVFIVHGHNDQVLEETSECVRRLGAEPVVLREQPAGGRTIIECLEEEAKNVHYAIVLMTGDDWGRRGVRYVHGKPMKWNETTRLRARQNVVFEAGLFIGLLGRDQVCVLRGPRLEMPTDLDGVRYIKIGDGWQAQLEHELRASRIFDIRHS